MAERNRVLKNKFTLILALLFVYILLFEFILPVNKFLPKPLILAESIVHIINDYNLLVSFTVTFSIVIGALVIGYIIIHLCAVTILKWLSVFRESLITLKLFRYLPFFVVIILFSIWFEDKMLGEFILTLLFVLTLSIIRLFEKIKDVKEEYVVTAKNLGLSGIEIQKKVFWRYLQPVLIRYYESLIISLWGIALIFEFTGNTTGLGYAFRQALAYKDLNAIILFCILLYVFVWFTSFIIKAVRTKYFNWAEW
jgi:ABC-type nitrate/sulfonate/bicarbonate transport system permease component